MPRSTTTVIYLPRFTVSLVYLPRPVNPVIYLPRPTNPVIYLPCPANPAISVVIPLYNAEKYIGECLESVLNQTFQSFEVIVVDDCSTDSSRKIVESYREKFGGRLKISKTETNSGGGGYVPRNIGLKLASGEYVIFIDSDDFILLTALETLYNVAKEYNADVVYTGAYFRLESPKNIVLHRDGEGKKLIEEGLEDKPDLRIDDQKGNLSRLLLEENEGNFREPWSKLVRRDTLIEHGIYFPQKVKNSGDFIWVINVYCYSKRFLRIPTPLCFHRFYNVDSVSRLKRESSQQISYWISTFLNFALSLYELEKKEEILSGNPDYCLAALKSHFKYTLSRIKNERKDLSILEIYEILHNKFNNRNKTIDLIVPFLFSIIDEDRRVNDAHLQDIKKLEKQIEQLKESLVPSSPDEGFVLPALSESVHLAISVIIPLYNAEKYIGECLDSLLNQTFPNFEVIVVDDCSTDNSFKIVERYIPKFNGRLTFAKMEKNSGSGGLPRNKGIQISCDEYIQFLDADDTLTKTALEEMYTLAKDYDAEVVYCEKHYCTDADGTNIRIRIFQKEPLVDKPTLESEDFAERVEKILESQFVVSTCFKFVRRKFIVKNELFFPHICPAEDDIWTYALVFNAKKFLRVPNSVYIRRLSDDSVIRRERTAQQTINFWMNPLLFGLKTLDNFMNRHEFFKINPSRRYAILKYFVDTRFWLISASGSELTEDVIYSTIKEEFCDRLGEYDVLIPALCSVLNKEKELLNKFASYFTARIDVLLIPKTDEGNFQIISVSDSKAKMSKPSWFQKEGIGYVITSYVGKLEFVVKSSVDGEIKITLRGNDIRDPEDNSKRLPYWIDFTKFTVNEQTIFDTLTPIWHNKPYRYNVDVKTDEEITFEIEWLPPRKAHSDDTQVINKFYQYITARLDIKLTPETSKGDFLILSTSDYNAMVTRPGWFQKGGIGYQIQSYFGTLKIIAKATENGQVKLSLKGVDARNPKDKKKRLPYWIDYTKLAINEQTIFDKLTPTWHDKPYRYKMDAKAGEEIIIEVEWLPHRSDT